MHRVTQAYMQTKVTTTSQGDVLLMLYDGALKFLNQAKERLAANDMAGKGNNISKALDVIHELDSSLNMEKGGDLAQNLHNLYFFCSKRLVIANLKKSTEMIDEVIKILSGLRGAYAEIASLPEAQAAAQQAAANQRVDLAPPMRQASGLSGSGTQSAMPGTAFRATAMYEQHKAHAGEGEEPLPPPAAVGIGAQTFSGAPLGAVLPAGTLTAGYPESGRAAAQAHPATASAASKTKPAATAPPSSPAGLVSPGFAVTQAYAGAAPGTSFAPGRGGSPLSAAPLSPTLHEAETTELPGKDPAQAMPPPTSGFGKQSMAVSALYRKFSG